MRKLDDGQLFSASALVNFRGCPRATRLSPRQLVACGATARRRAVVFQEKGIAQRAFLARFRGEGRAVWERSDEGAWPDRVAKTRAALAGGTARRPANLQGNGTACIGTRWRLGWR